MSSLARYRECFAEHASVSDDAINTALGKAAERMAPEQWGKLFEQGALYLAAHLVELSLRAQAFSGSGTSGAGAVTSVREGDLSVSFGSAINAFASTGDAGYATTPYGIEYVNLKKTRPVGAFVVEC